MPRTNKAVCQPAKKATPLEVKYAPCTPPSENEKSSIKNAAVAINPIDWEIQQKGDLMFTWLDYPFVLGTGVTG